MTTVEKIYEVWKQRGASRPRAHLGASVIGRSCERWLWYDFRWVQRNDSFAGDLYRLWDRGKREEPVFAEELRQAGITFHDVNPETGRQFSFSDWGGHFAGSMDGAGKGFPEAPEDWHVVEFKTHNAASFRDLVKHGVAHEKPDHVAQMQCYMGWSGMDSAFYLAVNKNTDELYAERVAFDEKAFHRLRRKAKSIIFSPEPPPKLHENPENWECAYCRYHDLCHGDAPPERNCRTCRHAAPLENGEWGCDKLNTTRSVADQWAACPEHALIPELAPAAVAKLARTLKGNIHAPSISAAGA